MQRDGIPVEIVVSKGDMINEGQLIGKDMDNSGAHIHATVPGKVIDIGEYPSVNGMTPTVVIEAEGAFITSGSLSSIKSWEQLDIKEITERIVNSGITGLRHLIPVPDKIPPDTLKNADILIINGAESEPYLTSDDILMKTYPDEILDGIKILLRITGIKKAYIAVEDNKKQAIKILKEAVKKTVPDGSVSVKSLKNKYPQGMERLLVYGIVGNSISSYPVKPPVLNISTVYSVRDAVLFNKPVIDRYITVSGSMINRPGNYKVRIGTRISDIIEECGGLKGDTFLMIMGGPICGKSVNSMNIPVDKDTTAVLFLAEDEVRSDDEYPCIRCGRCLAVCPAGLVPRDIACAVEMKRPDLVEKKDLDACIKCNCCSYICPSKRPLSYLINSARGFLQ